MDISVLEDIDQAIFVRDLQLGDHIEVLTDPDEMIVRVSATREVDLGIEEEEEVLEAEEAVAEGEVPSEDKEETPAETEEE